MVISKVIDFDYGHRVWTQELNNEYSIDNRTVCRHLHGHRGQIEVQLKGEVQKSGMVTDFKHLNWFKKWVDDHVDHKFIIDINDPLLPMLIPNYQTFGFISSKYFKTVNCSTLNDPLLHEFYESFTVVNFVPTSENLSKWFHEVVQDKMAAIGIKVHSIIFKETPKSTSIYEN